MSIDYQDISELSVRRFAAGRTAGLAAGIAAAVLIIALDDAAFFPDGPTFPDGPAN